VGRIGRGPNEFTYIFDMAVDPENDNVYLYGFSGPLSILAFDATGNNFARNDSIVMKNMSWSDGQLIGVRQFYGRTTDTDFVEAFSPDLKSMGRLELPDRGPNSIRIPMGGDRYATRTVTFAIMSSNGKSALIKEARNDTVFHFQEGPSLRPAYYLNMGIHSIPAEAYIDVTGYDNMGGNKYKVTEIIDDDRYVFVTTSEIGEQDIYYHIFDRNNSFGGLTALGPDGEAGLFLGGIKFAAMYIRDNRLVGYMQAIDIVDNAAAITDPELKALAATLREDSNPVIVVATLKK
jgi:hypothetical protein